MFNYQNKTEIIYYHISLYKNKFIFKLKNETISSWGQVYT